MMKQILDKVDNIKSQRKDYNDKLAAHFKKIKKRLGKEHKRLRNKLQEHAERHGESFDGLNKILEAMKKQNEGKPAEERNQRLEEKMDKVLATLSERDAKKAAAAKEVKAKEAEDKQKEYWDKMKEFLESFKAKQFGKLSQGVPMQAGDNEAAASSAFQVGDNMPWFLQQAVNNNAQLNGMFTHSDSDSAVAADSESDESYRRRLSLSDDALDLFLEDYGPETAVGASFWDLDNADELFEDSSEELVGAPRWEDYDVDDSEDFDSSESESDSSEWSDSESLDLESDDSEDESEVGVEFEEYPLSETDPEESEFEDILHFFRSEDDPEAPEEEFKVGSLTPTTLLTSFCSNSSILKTVT